VLDVREQLLTAVRGRVDAAVSSGDATTLLAEEAADEADRLLGLLARADDLDIEVAYVAGIFHLLRADGRGEQGQDDQNTAAILLAPIYLTHPDLLPEPVRSWLAAAYQAAEPAGAPPQHALAEAHNNLGMLLLGRLIRLGERHSGVAAVGLLRLAADVLPTEHPSRALALCNLGYARMLVESADGEVPAAIDDIVAVLREAFRLTPQGDPNRARCANGLALAVRAKAAASEDVPLLIEAIDLFRTAVDAATGAEPNLPQMLTDLAASLLAWWRGTRDADPTAVDEAITALMRALANTPRDAPEFAERWRLMERLQMARATRDARVREDRRDRNLSAPIEAAEALLTGSTTDQAAQDNPFVAVLRLLGMGEPGDSRHAELMNFGRTVLRFPHRADMEDVQRVAMETLLRQFADLEPDQLPEALAGLLSADDRPAPARLDPASLDEVVALTERLLRELPEDDPDRLLVRLTHGQLALLRLLPAGSQPGEQSVETLAGEASRVMAELAPVFAELPRRFGQPALTTEWIEQMAALGRALLSPFETLSVVGREVRRYRRRLADLPEGHPDHPPTATYLAHALFHRYQHTFEENVFQEAVTLTRRLAAGPSPNPKLVSSWGMAAAARMRMDSLTISPGDDPTRSTGIAALAARMAADAISAGDPVGALEHLEDARATMLSAALHTRREVDTLRRADPELAERFVALREQIYAGLNPGMEPRPGGQQRFMALAEEWSRLIGRITALPGFDRFLMPVTLGLADLAPAAADGPVVAVNLDPRRCDALVLRDGRVRAVRLPELRAADLVEQADAFQAAIAALSGQSAVDGSLVVGAAGRTVLDTLGWLWDVLAGPVLDALGLTAHAGGHRPWPRLWWSPTGPLTFLPLHAAGRHDTSGASVLDRVVSSYTPTLRALLRSRSRRTPSRRTALAVAMPETPGHAALPATVREATAFTGDLGGPAALIGPAATRGAVRAALPGAAIAHFACHASSDPADAAASHLLLHDGPLTVTEISQLRLDGAELAYLSACATARGSMVLADEAIHVASACQLAGYAQAVGTLWEVGDAVAARVAAEFHRELAPTLGDPVRPAGALALHTVTRRLRAESPAEPWGWAGYLHAGA
jgi:hypothetical protein